MAKYEVHFWKTMPLFRLLLPFVAGIIFQWYIGFTLVQMLVVFSVCIVTYFPFYWLPQHINFSWGWLQGVALMVLLFTVGTFITHHNDIRHKPSWIGNLYKDSSALLVTIEEPLVEKSKSYKALVSVEAIAINGDWKPVKGKMLLYFKKDSVPPSLKYGSQIVFSKPLQPIANSGNPGTFNYQRYCAFSDIYHQCFLKQGDYVITNTNAANPFQQWLYNIRFAVNASLKKYIKGEKEQGVAEALLIGYRDDLDKDLVQAYSNTGVVHIIAISGLHLGMIYLVMNRLFKLFKRRRWVVWVRPIVILGVLWIFSLVAGAAPSILRSAVMFSCLLLGEIMNKKSGIFNMLATCAFIMLCFNPFALWDVGFQLSYAAVLSIVIFMKPIYNWFYVKNKTLNFFWELNAVTLSAQILTVPIVFYHFHQFPNLFFITNFVAVPLSTIILFGELGIVLFDLIFSPIAKVLGYITSWLLWAMNSFIEKINTLSYAVSGGIQVSILQTIILYTTLIFFSYWLLRKSKMSLYIALLFTALFLTTRSIDFYRRSKQEKMIVYNIPQHTAIDFVSGRNYQFAGDTALLQDDFLQNFHLKPSRILNRIAPGSVDEVASAYPFFVFKDKKILWINKPFKFEVAERIAVDVIVLSKNPKIYINNLNAAFNCKLYVFDGSNPVWKINQWKKDCDSLHLRHHSTQDKGALELDL
jgi:competence protein ComEC